MDSFRAEAVASSIAAVRQAWLAAVKAGDAEGLAAMVTDDIVVVHGNGGCVHGKDELSADFRSGFETCSMEQSISSAEVAVRGGWDFEVSEVESTLTPRAGGASTYIHSTTVVALHRQRDGSWKVGRVLGVLASPRKMGLNRLQKNIEFSPF